VGEVLGTADDAVYLREPITQGLHAAGLRVEDTVDVDPLALPAPHRRIAAAAFAALPAFAGSIVPRPGTWGLGARGARRLVVKEINPLLLEHVLGRHRPRLVTLLRHPAAVALSYARLGWSSDAQSARLARYLADVGLGRWTRPLETATGFWARQGAFQGAAQRVMLDRLLDRAPSRAVRYEDLCAAPVEEFRALFAFAGLAWSETTAAAIETHSAGGDEADTYGTRRDSRAMIDRWRARVRPEDLAALRSTYAAFELPWYSSEDDWRAG
jgi:hypothetical protein